MQESEPFTQAVRSLFSPLLERAVRLAAQGHYSHFRKRETSSPTPECPRYPLPDDHIPYITHLMGTAIILARLGARDEVLAAALLHDYLEDVPDPDGRETIRATVGDEVLKLILAVTEDKRREQAASDTWKVRKREQVAAIAGMPYDAVLLKAADMLHNLLSLLIDLRAAACSDSVWQRFHSGPEQQLWYFRSALAASRARLGDHPLLSELENVINQVEELAPPPATSR